MGLRLSSGPSVLALVMDVLVLAVAVPVSWDSEQLGWIRVAAGIVSVVAVVLGIRSAAILIRET